MIAFLEGTLDEKTADALTVNVGGVGFSVRATRQALSGAGQRGDKLRVLTVMVVREDSMELFGFATREERDMFSRLTTVSGIGPKIAMGILSALSPADIAIAVMAGDTKALTRAPGVGNKTAQRIVVELRDSVKADDIVAGPAIDVSGGGPAGEALEALMALGYTSSEAAAAISSVKADRADQMILLALRKLGEG